MKLLPRLIIALLVCLIAIPVLAIPDQVQAAAGIELSNNKGYVGTEIRVVGTELPSNYRMKQFTFAMRSSQVSTKQWKRKMLIQMATLPQLSSRFQRVARESTILESMIMKVAHHHTGRISPWSQR